MIVHSSRIQKQIEYLRSLGIDPGDAYSAAGIKPGEENNPEKTFPFDHYHRLLQFAYKQTGDINYGLKFGSRPELGGTVGMMSASSRNLREAFITGCQFIKVLGNFADLKFVDDQKYPGLVYSLAETWPLQNQVTARIEVDAMFAFLNTILRINSNDTLRPRAIKLIFTRPEDISAYISTFGIEPEFGQESNMILFYNRDLLIPMKAFNPETFSLLKAHLEDQLERLDREESISEKVKRVILSFYRYHFPDIETVASKLNLSPRTLQRYLSTEETSFKSILQDTKTEIARKLLAQEKLTISEIGYTLGYSDLGNFSRSFKKATGMSPQEYRSKSFE